VAVIDLARNIPAGVDALLEPVRRGDNCFYCGRPLTSPAIGWIGASGILLVHPSCQVEWSLRMGRDVWEIECSTGIDVTARTLPELRERLLAEEGRS
jgi:hypothetical protein